MSKKKYIAILPGLAILSLVGAGFSTWYFQTSDTRISNIDVVVTDYLDTGRLDVTGSLKLVLDQTAFEQNGYDDQLGLHFEGSLTLTYHLPKWQSFNGDDAASGDAQTAENVITGIDDEKLDWTYDLTPYVNPNQGDQEQVSVEETYKKYISWNKTPAISTESTPAWKETPNEALPNEYIYVLTLDGAAMNSSDAFAFKYADRNPESNIIGEPKSLAEYEQMVADLQNTHIQFYVGVAYSAD